jgi:hypothetical protein
LISGAVAGDHGEIHVTDSGRFVGIMRLYRGCPDHWLIKVAMATRQERIDAFVHEGEPPTDQPLEILCEDHAGTYVIPFLRRWNDGIWQNVNTSRRIEATVIGWRVR